MVSSHVANTVGVNSEEGTGERECERDYSDGGEEHNGGFATVLLASSPGCLGRQREFGNSLYVCDYIVKLCPPRGKFCDLLLCSVFHPTLTMLTPREKDFSVIMRHMEALLKHGLSHVEIFHEYHRNVSGSSLPSCPIADNVDG